MVAELTPALSDAMPGLARRVQLGDRFHYWRGRSGQRYLFSAVPFDALVDFRSAVAMLAEPMPDGRFLAWAIADIDSAGRLRDRDGSWPRTTSHGSVAFVHFLTDSAGERQDLIDDLFTPAAAPALNLAA